MAVTVEVSVDFDAVEGGPRGSTIWSVTPAGRRHALNTPDIRYENEIILFGSKGLKISEAIGGERPGIWLVTPAGRRYKVAEAPRRSASSEPVAATVSTYGSRYWSDNKISQAKAAVKAEVQRRMTQDLSGFTIWQPGYNGVSIDGQSYAQEDSTSGRFFTALLAARRLWQTLGLSVGPDARPHAAGPLYLPYGGGASQRAFYPLYENVVGGSNDDLIFSEANASIGNYPYNARGGDRSPVFAFVLGWLCQSYLRQTLLPTDRNIVVMNKSKGGASLAQILGPGSDGLARFLHMHTVFSEAVAAGPHAAWQKQWLATLVDHGEYDEAVGTTNYSTSFAAAMDTTWGDIQSKTGQTRRPPWLMAQVASDRGQPNMVCARQQISMSKALTGTLAYAVVHRVKSEVATAKDTDMLVESENSHPILPSKVLAGIRDAIGVFYWCVLGQPLFTPYVHKYTREGDIGLASLASMTGDLKVSSLPYGCTQKFMSHLGFEDRNTSDQDADTPVDARIIPGTSLIEFKFASAKGDGRQIAAGSHDGSTQFGQVYVRDTFDIEQPVTIRFDETMRRWHNPLYGDAGDTGQGYLEMPGAAGLSRGGYVNQVAGIVDCKIELGNPCARDIVASTTLE